MVLFQSKLKEGRRNRDSIYPSVSQSSGWVSLLDSRSTGFGFFPGPRRPKIVSFCSNTIRFSGHRTSIHTITILIKEGFFFVGATQDLARKYASFHIFAFNCNVVLKKREHTFDMLKFYMKVRGRGKFAMQF